MFKVFAFFFLLGCLAAWRGKAATRAYNRRMFPSMQESGPGYLWPLILFTSLGLAAATVFRFIESQP